MTEDNEKLEIIALEAPSEEFYGKTPIKSRIAKVTSKVKQSFKRWWRNKVSVNELSTYSYEDLIEVVNDNLDDIDQKVNSSYEVKMQQLLYDNVCNEIKKVQILMKEIDQERIIMNNSSYRKEEYEEYKKLLEAYELQEKEYSIKISQTKMDVRDKIMTEKDKTLNKLLEIKAIEVKQKTPMIEKKATEVKQEIPTIEKKAEVKEETLVPEEKAEVEIAKPIEQPVVEVIELKKKKAVDLEEEKLNSMLKNLENRTEKKKVIMEESFVSENSQMSNDEIKKLIDRDVNEKIGVPVDSFAQNQAAVSDAIKKLMDAITVRDEEYYNDIIAKMSKEMAIKIKKANYEIEMVKADLENTKGLLNSEVSKNEELANENNSLEETVVEKTAMIDQKDEEIKSKNLTIAKNEEEITSLNTMNNEKSKTIENYSETIKQQQLVIESKNIELQEKEIDIKELNEDIDFSRKLASNQEQQLLVYKTKAETENDLYNKKISDLNDRITLLEQENEMLKKQLEARSARKSENNFEVSPIEKNFILAMREENVDPKELISSIGKSTTPEVTEIQATKVLN